MASIVEQCKISPHHVSKVESESEFSLPVLFWDMMWYNLANRSLLFFKFACSKSHFIRVIVPELKRSLSLTLSHFLSLAGNILHPLNENNRPIIHYVPGDSVSFKVCVSINPNDFDHFIGNDPKCSDDLYAFAPTLHTNSDGDYISCSTLAIQVTLFPGHGICVGLVTHHAAVDGRSVVCFMKAWSLVNHNKRFDDDTKAQLVEGECMPFYDRRNVVEINGLDTIFWEQHKLLRRTTTVEPDSKKFPTNKVRTTFVLKKNEIEMLKKHYLSAKRSDDDNNARIIHLSTFSVTCALVWICSAKSDPVVGDEEEEVEYFVCMADCRSKMKLPGNYFGNNVALCRAELKHSEVKGNDGFVLATEAIGEAIRERVYGEKGILHGAEDWPNEYLNKLVGKRSYGVVGSPKFDFYDTDFGWGRPKKFEALFLDDLDGNILISSSHEFEGGLEIGFSKPKAQMETFTSIFNNVLQNLMLH